MRFSTTLKPAETEQTCRDKLKLVWDNSMRFSTTSRTKRKIAKILGKAKSIKYNFMEINSNFNTANFFYKKKQDANRVGTGNAQIPAIHTKTSNADQAVLKAIQL